jgi:Transcriptional regulators
VSETTVLRLAHLLGFSGYQEMRSTMANLLMNHLSTLERLKDYESAQEYDFFERAIRKDLKTLTLALSNISSKDLNRLGEAMAKADAVYLAGYRSSFSLTYYLSFYLSWILPNVKNVSLDMPFEMLANAPSGSIVLGISFPRYSSWTVQVLETAAKLGLTTAAVTDNLASPLAQQNYVLSVPYKPVSFIDSFAAPMSVLNCLILSVAQHLGENVTEKLGMLERRWREDEVYTNQKEL